VTTIIRRSPRRRGGLGWGKLALLAALFGSGAMLALVWVRGGPQPVREIAIPLPEPALSNEVAK